MQADLRRLASYSESKLRLVMADVSGMCPGCWMRLLYLRLRFRDWDGVLTISLAGVRRVREGSGRFSRRQRMEVRCFDV